MSFLPQDYKAPERSSGTFLKLPKDGEFIRVVVCGVAAVGWLYWTNGNECKRSPEKFESTPDIKLDEKTGKPTGQKHFWLLPVIDMTDPTNYERKVLEITQSTIQDNLMKMIETGEYVLSFEGNEIPDGLSALRIERSGSGLKTKYNVLPAAVTPNQKAALNDVLQTEAINVKKVAFESTQSADTEEVTPAPEVM